MSDWTTTGTPVSVDAAGNYIDNTDVDNWDSGATAAEMLATIQRAEQLIEKITKDYFYAKAFVIYRDGQGTDYLNLKLYPDVITVTEVLLHGIELNSSWWTYDVWSVYLDPESATGGIDDPELLLRLKGAKGIFSKGTNNIKITGTYGWTTTPPAIIQAAVILCRYENDGTLYTAYDDVVSDKLDDAMITRGTKKFLTGVQEADRLIRNYIRKKPIFGG